MVLINLISLPDNHELAAPTGVTETTREAKDYFHPTNKNIVFWDLPGIGMSKYVFL